MVEKIKKADIILMGAGGHAKVIIEILHQQNLKIAYCLGSTDSPDTCLGIPVLQGNDDDLLVELSTQGYHKIFIAIGSNQIRLALAEKAKKYGFEIINAISSYAVISPSAKLGVGIAIMAGVVINADATIRDLVIINTGASIDHDCILDKAVHIGPQCGLAGNVKVGSESFLGIGTKVIPGILIGHSVISGAGTVIVKNIENAAACVGVPAKITKFGKSI